MELYQAKLMVLHAAYQIEHDMDFMRQFATSVTVLARGQVIADGSVAEELARAQRRLGEMAEMGLGLAGALIPPFLAWLYGYYIRKMNPVILAGACAGGRNSTPSLNGIQEISGSAIAAVAYPVPYAVTSALVLILGYISMVFS